MGSVQHYLFASKDLSFALTALEYGVETTDGRGALGFVKRYGLLGIERKSQAKAHAEELLELADNLE
jgi:hypothetical protein